MATTRQPRRWKLGGRGNGSGVGSMVAVRRQRCGSLAAEWRRKLCSGGGGNGGSGSMAAAAVAAWRRAVAVKIDRDLSRKYIGL